MIIRRRHTANFTTIGNALFDDERLAADEVGVLTFLLSRPNDWEIRRPALLKRWSFGRDSLRRIIRNLVRYGYCLAERKRREDGTTYMIYEIRDEPGPELTEDEAKRALALESSAAVVDQIDGKTGPADLPITGVAMAGLPSPAGPPTDEPSPAYIDSPRTESTKDDSTKQIERESETDRAKHATNLVTFKQHYPTTSSDDQVRLDNSWFALTLPEGEAAIARIPDFLAKQRKDGRTKYPAGFTYLAQKRWTLLNAAVTEAKPSPKSFSSTSTEAKAIRSLYAVARTQPYEHKNRTIYYPGQLTLQLLAFSEAGAASTWHFVDLGKAIASWSTFLDQHVYGVRPPFVVMRGDRRGIYVPWLFPPSIEGVTYPITEVPLPPSAESSTDLMTDADYENFDR